MTPPSYWFPDLGPFARYTLDTRAAAIGIRQDNEDTKAAIAAAKRGR